MGHPSKDEIQFVSPAPTIVEYKEHTKNARPSTKKIRQKGKARKARDKDRTHPSRKHRPPRKRPKGWEGPWPPKDGSGSQNNSASGQNPGSKDSQRNDSQRPDPDSGFSVAPDVERAGPHHESEQ